MSPAKRAAARSDGLPKHRRLYQHLKDAIAQGVYSPGERLPTENALIDEFGVSRTTVVRALHDLEHEGVLVRRRGSGSYVSEEHGARRRTFGLIATGLFPDANTGNNIFSQVFQEMSRLAGAKNCALLTGSPLDESDPDALVAEVTEVATRYASHALDGVFFMPLMVPADRMAANRRITDMLKKTGVPTVLIDRDTEPYPGRSEFDLVGIDNLDAGWVVTRHLLSLGCKRIHFVCSSRVKSTVSARVLGWRLALEDAGLEAKAAFLHVGDVNDDAFVLSSIKAARAEAFVCEHDGVAMTAIRLAREAKIKVPKRIRIVGFDGSPLGEHISVPLTTMRQPVQAIAETAVRVMLERLEDPRMPVRDIRIAAELVVRRSCGSRNGR